MFQELFETNMEMNWQTYVHDDGIEELYDKHGKTSDIGIEQESRVVARKQRDAAAVLFGLKFADPTTFTTSSRVAKL